MKRGKADTRAWVRGKGWEGEGRFGSVCGGWGPRGESQERTLRHPPQPSSGDDVRFISQQKPWYLPRLQDLHGRPSPASHTPAIRSGLRDVSKRKSSGLLPPVAVKGVQGWPEVLLASCSQLHSCQRFRPPWFPLFLSLGSWAPHVTPSS